MAKSDIKQVILNKYATVSSTCSIFVQRGSVVDSILKIAADHEGFVTAAAVSSAGLQRRLLSEAVATGVLIRVDRGLYCLPETWEDEYVIAQHRFSRGVFSHDTSLYLQGLSDRAPESLTLTFPRGYNTSNVRQLGIVSKVAPRGQFELGLTIATTMYGNEVTIYDAERSLCDMIRGTSDPDTQVFVPALKSYLSSSRRNTPKLQDVAERLGVARKMNGYLGVLL